MAENDKTMDRLQHLETLYRQGYRSDVIDRSLEKIIALEHATAQRELEQLQERLRAFETQYQIPSGDGDAMDMVEWSVFYEMWESVRARLATLETALI
jgi:hypothetical protein